MPDDGSNVVLYPPGSGAGPRLGAAAVTSDVAADVKAGVSGIDCS